MEIITTTLTYTPTVALVTVNLANGTPATVAVVASTSVVDIWIAFLLALLVFISLARMVKEWRR